MSFKELVQLYMLDSQEFDRLSTVLKKRNMIDKYILPYFKDYNINKLNALIIKQFKIELNRYNLSTNYKRSIFITFKAIINYAIKFDYLQDDPSKAIKNYSKEKKFIDFWTINDFKQFIKYVDYLNYKTMFTLLFFTGARKGEILALTWSDIDLNNKYLIISKSCSYNAKNGYIVTSPKNETSKRKIVLDNNTVELLKEYKQQCLLSDSKNNFLFKDNNNYLARETVRRYFKRCISKSGVKDIRLHDLRHSHASMLIHLKQDPLVIKKRLGHADIQTTLNIYSHLYEDSDIELIDKINSLNS